MIEGWFEKAVLAALLHVPTIFAMVHVYVAIKQCKKQECVHKCNSVLVLNSTNWRNVLCALMLFMVVYQVAVSLLWVAHNWALIHLAFTVTGMALYVTCDMLLKHFVNSTQALAALPRLK